MDSSSSKQRKRSNRKVTGPVEIEMAAIGASPTTIEMVTMPNEDEENEISPLIEIIKKTKRKKWAKLVAPVDEENIKKYKPSFSERIGKLFSRIPTPCRLLLDAIERRKGFTIRSYFQFILWLFYLNLFTFLICFTCIVLPTFIYPSQLDFYTLAINEYNKTNSVPSDFCSFKDPQCALLNQGEANASESICLENTYTASGCCSANTDEYYRNLSDASRVDSTKFFSDLIDGTGVLSVNRLFLGYYRNLTRYDDQSTFQNYNMGLAVLLANIACLLITGIAIVRKYGDGMNRSYVQNESFENNLFQYIFARWDYRSANRSIMMRHKQRFKTEIQNILLERKDKTLFIFDQAMEKILFKIKRFGLWLLTLGIFGGAVTAIYFTNQYTFQERSKREERKSSGEEESDALENRALILAIEYLPAVTMSMINLLSQFIFDWMKGFKLYTSTTNVRHYLLRVIMMRLILLFAFIFIIILQITCNSNECGRQSEATTCADVKGAATFIHCWETVLGQVVYRLVLTDTAVMLIVHLIVDPLRTLFIRCCSSSSSRKVDDEDDSENKSDDEKCCGMCKPLEFEIVNYVLDLTYTQTLCWHGFLFCPFLSLIAALKNVVIFFIKLLSVSFFRQRSQLELSPARARYVFTTVLLFSFIWAVLPIIFFITVLRPSRGCGPFRLYSSDSNHYVYAPIRNLFNEIPFDIPREMILTLTSGIVVIPVVLILILISCILIIRRNSYRSASVELYKILSTTQKTHQIAVYQAYTTSTDF